MNDLFIIFAMSLLTFSLYGWDKHLAIYHKKRIPEFLLLFFAALAGGFGALCGMILFRHKTQHMKFLVFVPVFVALQMALDVAYRLWPH